MKKIYIVTSGEYSGYQIEAVFDDKDIADKYAAQTPDSRVEIYTLNSEVIREKMWYEVSLLNGTSDIDVETTYFNHDLFMHYSSGASDYTFVVEAENVEKAKAIALERYHAHKASWLTHYAYGMITSVWYGYFDHTIYVNDATDIVGCLKLIAPRHFSPWRPKAKTNAAALKELQDHGILIEDISQCM